MNRNLLKLHTCFSRRTNSSGFTLLEIIVSIGLFSVVATIALGSLISVLDANNKNRSIQIAIDSINFAVDDISREIRFGSSYHCETGSLSNPHEPLDCAAGGNYFAFEGATGSGTDNTDQIVYRLSGGVIEKSTDSGSNYLAVTAPDVTINNLRFFVEGAQDNDTDSEQGKVRVVVDGTVDTGKENTSTDFSIQTSISERSLPFTISVTGEDTDVTCPFLPGVGVIPADGSIIVHNAETRSPHTFSIHGSSNWHKMAGVKELTTPVPAGTYDVYVASYDDHSACTGPGTPSGTCHDNVPSGSFLGERLRLQLLNYGSKITTTGATSDIPWDESTWPYGAVDGKVNDDLTIDQTVTHIYPIPADAQNATDGNTYSFVWLCAAFVNVGSGDPIDIDEF